MSVNDKNLKINEAINFVKNNKEFFLASFVSDHKINKLKGKSFLESEFQTWFDNLDGAIKESVQTINGSLNYALGAEFGEIYAIALVGSDTDTSCVKYDNYDKFKALLNDNENLVNALISLKFNPGIDQWYVDHNNKIAEAEQYSIQNEPTQAQSMNNDNKVELQSVYLTIRISDDDEYPFNQPDADWQKRDRDLYISVSELNDENNLKNTLLTRIQERKTPLLVTKEKGRISTQGHEETQQQLDIHRITYVMEIKIPKDIAAIIPKATSTVYNNTFELPENSFIKVDQIQNISLDSKFREYHVIALCNKPESDDKLSLDEHEIAVYEDNGNWFCIAPDKGTFQLKEEDLIKIASKDPAFEGGTNEDTMHFVNYHLNQQVNRANRYNGRSDLCRDEAGQMLGLLADLILNTAVLYKAVDPNLEIKYHLPDRVDFVSQPALPSSNLLKDKISLGYEYGTNNKTRSHLYTVKPTTLDEQYINLKGDALKRQILLDFKSKIESCKTTEDLDSMIKKLKASPEYDILNTPQRPFTKYLGELAGVETSAINAFNDMEVQAKKILSHSSDNVKTAEEGGT